MLLFLTLVESADSFILLKKLLKEYALEDHFMRFAEVFCDKNLGFRKQ